MTIYNMTKDLYKDNISNVLVGVFDVLKYRDIIKALGDKLQANKYFGFEILNI